MSTLPVRCMLRSRPMRTIMPIRIHDISASNEAAGTEGTESQLIHALGGFVGRTWSPDNVGELGLRFRSLVAVIKARLSPKPHLNILEALLLGELLELVNRKLPQRLKEVRLGLVVLGRDAADFDDHR